MVCSRYPKELRHYEKNLKKKCFFKLKNNVWENKTKWQLILRADCYYRFRLLSVCFCSWLCFVKAVRRKKLQGEKAEKHYERKLKRWVMISLNGEIERNGNLIRSFRRNLEWNFKKRIWDNWRQFVEFRRKIGIIKDVADGIRKERLIVCYLYIWSKRLGEKFELERKYQRSICLHENFLKRKSFNKLKIYANRHRFKAELINLAHSRYQTRLKKKIFSQWRKYSSQKKLHQNLIERIHSFHKKYLLKIYLEKWTTRYDERIEAEYVEKNYIANEFYSKKLLSNYFNNFKKLMKKKRRENVLAINFFEFYKTTILQFYLNRCRDALREKFYYASLEVRAVEWRQRKLTEVYLNMIKIKYQDKLRERVDLSNAVAYYENILLDKSFKKWAEFILWKKSRKSKIDEAFSFYELKMKAKIFENFKKFLFIRKKKKMAESHYKFILVLKALKKWKIFHQRKRIKMAKLMIVHRKYSMSIQRRAFNALKSEVVLMRNKNEEASKFSKRKLLAQILLRWKRYVKMNKINRMREDCVRNVINEMIIEKFLFLWYEQYEKKLFFKGEIEKMEKVRRKRVIRVFFNTWRKFVLKKKKLNEDQLILSNLRPLILLQCYISKLRDLHDEKKRLDIKNELAKKLEEKLIKRKYFRRWMSFKKWKEELAKNCENVWRCEREVERDIHRQVEWNPSVVNLKSSRKQPLIPSYLMNHIQINSSPRNSEGRNDETYRVLFPVNKRLPNIDSENWSDQEVEFSK